MAKRSQVVKRAKNDDEKEPAKKSYRVLGQGAIIGGKTYDKDDGEGGYGVVKLSPKEAMNHMERGVGLLAVKD